MKFGARVLYPMYLRDCEREYSIAGFPGGCIGNTNATHILLKKVCVAVLRQAHLDHKSKVTMRTYNLTCNHRTRWNDKTLICSDNFKSELHV